MWAWPSRHTDVKQMSAEVKRSSVFTEVGGAGLTLLSAAVLFITAVLAVVLSVAAERRRDALTVPALQQALALTGCTHRRVHLDLLEPELNGFCSQQVMFHVPLGGSTEHEQT